MSGIILRAKRGVRSTGGPISSDKFILLVRDALKDEHEADEVAEGAPEGFPAPVH